MQWNHYNYYNQIYGSRDFWNGGANLTRIQNFGGGSGMVWDGGSSSSTIFMPASLFNDGSRYVQGIVPYGLRAQSFAFKMSQQEVAEALIAGTIGWSSEGFATVNLLQWQGREYSTLSQMLNAYQSFSRFGLGDEIIGGIMNSNNNLSLANEIITGASIFNSAAKRITSEYISQLKFNNQLTGIKNVKYINRFKGSGRTLGIIGGILIVTDVMYNSEVRVSHTINGVMTVLSYTPLVPVSAIWFATDLGTGLITGRSISERIDSSCNPIIDWEY